MSEQSTQRFHSFPFFARYLFGLFDLLCVQNPFYQTRLQKAGASLQQLVVTGNLKLDEEYPHLNEEETIAWKKKLGIHSYQTVLTIGSTHYPEEEKIVEVLKNIWKKIPDLLVIIVPRHPERFKEVAQLLNREQVSFVKFTELGHYSKEDPRVILMDVMGLLRLCYQLADMAIVGGSFTDQVGGHNILEPCWYGKPVLFGPHMHSQLELVELIQRYQAGKQTTLEDLEDHLFCWITNCEERQIIGQRGLELVCNLKGATQRTLNRLNPLLKTFEPSECVLKEEECLIH